jgi:hypothetical protein
MLFLLPIAAGLIAWRVHTNKKNPTKLTPERQAIYSAGMTFLKDPTKLNKLADAFAKSGLKGEASALRKRAALPSLPKNLQVARQQALKDGLASKDPVAVNKLADAFEKEGAGSSAVMLRQYANGLATSTSVMPVKVQPEAKQPAATLEQVQAAKAQVAVTTELPPTISPPIGVTHNDPNVAANQTIADPNIPPKGAV